MRIENEKTLIYLGSKIRAYELFYNEFCFKKNKEIELKQIKCLIKMKWQNNKLLNLGECNDGAKFTAVNQAINQAKEFINYFKYKTN